MDEYDGKEGIISQYQAELIGHQLVCPIVIHSNNPLIMVYIDRALNLEFYS